MSVSLENIKRILILGHTGFIGRHLESHFQKVFEGVEVLGMALPDVDLTRIDDVKKLAPYCDLNTAMILCAAKKRQFGDNLDAFDENVRMTMNLCGLFEEHPIGRLVFFSSAAVYGEDVHNTNITEETPVCPTSYYGLAKYTSERIFMKIFQKQPGSSLLMIRPPLIYGPGDTGGTYGPVGFIKAALEQKLLTLWGDGTELREFLYVGDIVKVIETLIMHQYDGVVNVASGKSHTFKDVLNIIEKQLPGRLTLNSRERSKSKVDNAFDNTCIMKLLGNFSFTTLEAGICKTLAEMGKRGDASYENMPSMSL